MLYDVLVGLVILVPVLTGIVASTVTPVMVQCRYSTVQ